MTEKDLIGLSYIELQGMMIVPSEPPSISMWPETAAWYWLCFVVLVLIVYVVGRWLKVRKTNAYRRAAIKALGAAEDNAAEIAAIIRRTALVAYPRHKVASLHGEEWLKFLDKTGGKSRFVTDQGRQMLKAPYCGEVSVSGLNARAVDWVRCHRPEEAQ